LAGGLPGVEIWTRLTALEPRRTQVEVEFHLPHLTEAQAVKAGANLVALYTKLWDEDEAMMIARQQALDARGTVSTDPIALGPLEGLMSTLPLTINAPGGPVCIVGHGGEILAYPARCPHMKAPLAGIAPDGDGCITCPWHGYRFDIATGLSVDGRGLTLGPMPRLHVDADGQASLVWPR
jgi:nitrite reductase/ring-hydroxylating ferredoxin subunit